ncbi:MAG TPA: Ig-like domain-containing protein, partial [Gaiellaceae bacterium]|nr:Ig-like domain-containing protein [Gaiellaceae bacterium]
VAAGHALENDGRLLLKGGGLTLGKDATIDNEGTLELAGDTDIWNTDGGAKLTNGDQATIRKSAGGADGSLVGAAVEGDGAVDVAKGELDLEGDYTTDTAQITIGDGAKLSLGGADVDLGDGTTVTGGELAVEGGHAKLEGTLKQLDLRAGDGTVEVAAADTSGWSVGTLTVAGAAAKLTLDSPLSVQTLDQSNGTIAGDGDLRLTGDGSTWSGGTQSGFGATVVGAGADLALEGSAQKSLERKLDVLGDATWSAGDVALGLNATLRIEPHGTFDVTGSGTLSGFGSSSLEQYGTFTKSDGGATTISGFGTLDNHTDATFEVDEGSLSYSSGLDNEGDVTVGSGATLKTVGIYSQNDGSTTLDGGTLDTSGQPLQVRGGSLDGTGTVTAQVNNSGGLVTPGGESTGKLTVNGNYTQQGTGTLRVDVTSGGVDVLDLGNGKAFLDGTLNVVTAQGFSPVAGTSYPFILAGGGVSSGRFGSVGGLDLPNGGGYDLRYEQSDVAVKVKQPVVDVQDVSLEEGDSGVTPVDVIFTLSSPAPTPVTVDWQTADGSAVADQDYQGGSGTVTFPAGSVQQTVRLGVIGNTRQQQPDPRTFFVELSNPTGATLSRLSATVSIHDDDSGNGLDVVATAPAGGGGQFTSLGNGPAINDSGTVAFEAVLNGSGSSLFVRPSAGAVRNINAGFGASGARRFDDRVGITNDGIVVSQDRLSGSPPSTRIRIWDSHVGHDSQWVTLAVGGSSGSGGGSGVSFDPSCDPYSPLLAGGIGGFGATIGGCGQNTADTHDVSGTVAWTVVINPVSDANGSPLPGAQITLADKAFFDISRPLTIKGLIDSDAIRCSGQHLDSTGLVTILDNCHLLYSTTPQKWLPAVTTVTQTGVTVSAPTQLTASLAGPQVVGSNTSAGVPLLLDRQQYFDLVKPIVVTYPGGLPVPITCAWQHAGPGGVNTELEGCHLASPVGSLVLPPGAAVTQPSTSTAGVSAGWDSVNIPGIDNGHDPVFDALSGSDWYIVTESGQAGPYTGALRPFITDDGHVVARAGGSDTDTTAPVAPIQLWDDASLTGGVKIACGTGCGNTYSGFTQLGRAPGASSDAQIVAFEGTLPKPTSAFLQNIGVTGGAGIYASVKTTNAVYSSYGSRKLIQVASLGEQADDGSTITKLADPSSPTLQILGGDRVAVAGGTSSPDRTATVLFDALDENGNKGVYTVAIHFLKDAQGNFDPAAPAKLQVDTPHRLVAAGQTIKGLPGTVTDVEYWNPLNQRGQGDAALWVSMTDGTQAIVRSHVPERRPVVFVPGVAGSTLQKNGNTLWLTTDDFTILGGDPSELSTVNSPGADVRAPDALQYSINVLGHGVAPVYHDFLQRLYDDGGYTPYRLARDGTNYYAGYSCDYDGQKDDAPNFFVFPYDWRVDNRANAQLLDNYIENCVEKFWPDTKVNILTHSMGSLLARRYVLQNPEHAKKHVNAMITIAAPWLGAPKLDYVIESGGFVTEPGGVHVGLVGGPTIKKIVETMPAGHELMPSPWYFRLGAPSPLGDHTKTPFDDFTFPEMEDFLRTQLQNDQPGLSCSLPDCSYDPGQTARQFHDDPIAGTGDLQDDWRNDQTGIKYFHLYGQMGHFRTIMQTFLIDQPTCQKLTQDELEIRYGASLGGTGIGGTLGAAAAAPVTEECDSKHLLEVHFGLGDGTVPTVSASRKGPNGTNLNAPGATLIPFYGHPSDDDGNFDHNGMLNYRPVQDKVLELLNEEDNQAYRQANPSPLLAKVTHGTKTKAKAKAKARKGKQAAKGKPAKRKPVAPTRPKQPTQPKQGIVLFDSQTGGSGGGDTQAATDGGGDVGPALYLTVTGGKSLVVTNPGGDSTQVQGDFQYLPRGVSLYPVGPDATTAVLTDDAGYSATLASDGGPLEIVARVGEGDSDTLVQRYQAPALPAGTKLSLTSGTNGLDSVQYDSDGDGTPDTAIVPTTLTGAAASDVTPPTVSVAPVQAGPLQRVGISAADDAAGVRQIWYSTNGSLYFKYTQPFGVDPISMPIVYAFAEDNAGNRSSVVTFSTAGFPIDHPPAVSSTTLHAVERTPLTFTLPASDADGDPLTYAIDSQPANGTLSAVGADGTVTYTPSAGFTGTDSFTFHASDVIAPPVSGTVTIVVGPDTAPTAYGANVGVRPDTPRTLKLAAVDPDGTPVTFAVATQPQHGTLGAVGADGSVVYTPAAGYTGPDSFTFTASDGVLTSDPATMALQVVADRAPVAVGATVHAKPGAATTFALQASDPDNDPLTESIVRRAAHGTVTLNANGTVTYTSDPGFAGDDSFTWFASDGELDSQVATVAVDVHPNRAPVAADAAVAVKTNEQTPIVLNATDADEDGLAFAVVAQPAHGTLSAVEGNVVEYTPAAGFTGSDSFTFRANDGTVDSNVATVSITVADNRAPVAKDVAVTVGAGKTRTIVLPATDPDNDPLTLAIATQPAHGALGPLAGGAVAYTPADGYAGPDTFTYTAGDGLATSTGTVTVTVLPPANSAPTLADDTATTPEDTTATIAPLANDVDPDADHLRLVGVTQPAHGAAHVQPDGTVHYDPATDWNGTDTFTYKACDDGTTNGAPAPLCATATVTVTVTPVNDPPVAAADTLALAEDSSATLDVLANDLPGQAFEDGQQLTLTGVGAARHGTVSLEGGVVRYTPAADWNGADTFTYTVCDDGTTNGAADPKCATGTVAVTVWEVNDTPTVQPDTAAVAEDGSVLVNALVNDRPGPLNEAGQALAVTAVGAPGNGTAAVDPASGQIRYTPAPDYNGSDAFTYTTCDDGTTHGAADPQCATSTVTVTVWEVNDAPVAAPDAATTAEDTPLTVAPLANDAAGPANEAAQHLTLTTVLQPQHGTVSLTGSTVQYTPAPDYNGPDGFTYTVCDDGSTNGRPDPLCATGSVTLTVTPVNDPPVPTADQATVAEDSSVLVDVVANDSAGPADEAGQTLTLQSVGAPGRGTAVVKNGKLLYTPSPDANGPDTVTYTVCDDGTTNGAADPRCSTGTLTLTITEVNDSPQAGNDELTVPAGGSGSVDVLANDVAGPANESDQTLSITAVGTPLNGGTATAQGGTITYTAPAGYTGLDQLTYTICDNGTTAGAPAPRCDTAVVDVGVGVSAFNHTPQAHNGTAAMGEDDPPLAIDLAPLVGDRESSPAAMTYEIVQQPARGHVTVAGSVATYTPNPYTRGTDSFSYHVTDGGYPDGCGDASATCQAAKTSVTRTVTIAIAPVNHAPTVSIQAPASAGEGSAISLVAAASDPDSDTLTYTWTTSLGTLTANGPNATLVVPDGPAGAAVHVSVSDGNGGSAAADATIQIANVAPSATFANDGPVDDGQPFHLSLGAISDPSPADAAAGYSYAFDCGDGTYAASATPSATCPTADAGIRLVRARVTDRDGGSSEYAATVHVQSLPPAPTLTTSGPIQEGQSFTLGVTLGAGIPTAKYDYAFDCGDGSGYGAYGAAMSVTCATDDNALRTVRVSVRGHDGVVTEATATEDVADVAPTVSAGGARSGYWGVPVQFAGTASDPSPADTAAGLAPAWAWGDGTPSTGGLAAAHAYALPGTYGAVFSAVDKDGGRTQATSTVTVAKRPTALAYTGSTSAAYGFATLSAQLSDLVDAASAQLAGESVVFLVGSTAYTAKTDANGVATVTAPAPVAVGTFPVVVQFLGDARYAAARAPAATLRVVQSAGTVSGTGLVLADGGTASFAVSGTGTTSRGTLDWANGSASVHAAAIGPLGIAADRSAAWFGGVTVDGRQIRVHAGAGLFELWVNGQLVTGTGALAAGTVSISP